LPGAIGVAEPVGQNEACRAFKKQTQFEPVLLVGQTDLKACAEQQIRAQIVVVLNRPSFRLDTKLCRELKTSPKRDAYVSTRRWNSG